jgi:hypothetical protein
MKDPRYYVAQAADCRRLSLIAPDQLTSSRLNELAREYEDLVNDLVPSELTATSASASASA